MMVAIEVCAANRRRSGRVAPATEPKTGRRMVWWGVVRNARKKRLKRRVANGRKVGYKARCASSEQKTVVAPLRLNAREIVGGP